MCDCLWVPLLPYQTMSSPFFLLNIRLFSPRRSVNNRLWVQLLPYQTFFPVKMEHYFHLGGLCATVCGCICFPTKPRLYLFVLLDGTIFTSEDLRKCTRKPRWILIHAHS